MTSGAIQHTGTVSVLYGCMTLRRIDNEIDPLMTATSSSNTYVLMSVAATLSNRGDLASSVHHIVIHQKTCHSKVSNLDVTFIIDENVRCLDVTIYIGARNDTLTRSISPNEMTD